MDGTEVPPEALQQIKDMLQRCHTKRPGMALRIKMGFKKAGLSARVADAISCYFTVAGGKEWMLSVQTTFEHDGVLVCGKSPQNTNTVRTLHEEVQLSHPAGAFRVAVIDEVPALNLPLTVQPASVTFRFERTLTSGTWTCTLAQRWTAPTELEAWDAITCARPGAFELRLHSPLRVWMLEDPDRAARAVWEQLDSVLRLVQVP